MIEPVNTEARTTREFVSTLKQFDNAMLVTQRDHELRSRPMAIVDCTHEGHTWFITSIDSGKIDEMTAHPHVNVSLQQSARFMSISGTVRMTRDAQKIDEVWKPEHGAWFELGGAFAVALQVGDVEGGAFVGELRRAMGRVQREAAVRAHGDVAGVPRHGD